MRRAPDLRARRLRPREGHKNSQGMTRGDKDAQQFPASRFQPLYCLRGEVWSRPILFVANPDLFKKMRWTAHGSPRKRSQMADVHYATAQQHLWAGRRFRNIPRYVLPP